MLRFELIRNNGTEIAYKYFPEGKKQHGEITVRKKDKSVIQADIAPSDDFKWYYFKMLNRIFSYIEKDSYEEKGTIAWY